MIETRTHLLVVNYDESQNGILETYGVNAKQMTKVLNAFIHEANRLRDDEQNEDTTFAALMMRMISSGKIEGGILLALATHDLINLLNQQNAHSELRGIIREVLHGDLGDILSRDEEDEEDDEDE